MDEENNILPITLKIQGISYVFDICRNDEEEEVLHRQAEKLVNSWMTHWSSTIRGDKEDCLAMTALTIAINSIREEIKHNKQNNQLSELEALSRQIDDCLNKL